MSLDMDKISTNGSQSQDEILIGVIADTHGLIRPEALQALAGVDLIFHAGDVGKRAVIEALVTVAPVAVVRGNSDWGEWVRDLPETQVAEIRSVRLYMLHDLNELDVDPAAAGFNAVISGHSHQPAIAERNGVLFLNPGSAGPRRFNLPVSLGLLRLKGGALEAELIYLKV